MLTLKRLLEENGWVRSIIAIALVATWIATIFAHITMDDQGKAFIYMAIAYYLARPTQTPPQ